MKTTNRSRMQNPQSAIRNPQLPAGFTLMELLIVMLIIAVLAALALTALQGAAEESRADRTRAIVAKLDQLVMQRWNDYRTRPLPIRVLPGTPSKSEPFTDANGNGFWNTSEAYTDRNQDAAYTYGAAYFRLMALRELQRCELPERISDLCSAAELADLTSGDNDLDAINLNNTAAYASLGSAPALSRAYRRKAAMTVNAGQPWTAAHQGAECLYLIISTMHDGDKNALDFFMPGEIGDIDGDGMREILDGWKQPIEFLRWAPGYVSSAGPDGAWGVLNVDDDLDGNVDNFSELGYGDDGKLLTVQRADIADPFDPVKEDQRATYALRPLVYSGGRDKSFDMSVGTPGAPVYAFTVSPNDPYWGVTSVGVPADSDADGYNEWADNITNHFQPTNAP